MAARGFLRVLGAMSMVFSLGNCLASTDTITWGGDNSRSGYQPNKNMDPAVVASSDFGQIFQINLPGNYMGVKEEFFSMPLVYTPGNDENGRQFLYLATTQNNVYKLDAKTGEILAQRNLGIPFLARDLNTTDLGFCYDITPTVGIIGTGVIDPATDTLYLAAKTYSNQNLPNVPQGRPAGRYNIHALNVNDLTERPNFPINFEGQDARNNVGRPFNGGMHNQRPGLLHPAGGQNIYIAFGSHCVLYNFTGRIIGFDKTSGKLVEHFATLGQDVRSPTKGAGIWMSGGGLASDDKGSMFYSTGNGYASQLHDIPVNGRNPPTALEEAVVHHTILENGTLNVVDFFMPEEKEELDGADNDLGTSPFELLPSEFSCGNVRRIGVVTGKSGWTYFLNLDDLGGYRTNLPYPRPKGQRDRILAKVLQLNSVYAGAGVYPGEGGYIYIPVINNPTTVIQFTCSNGVPSFAKVGETPERNGGILGISHGTVTSLNGQPGTGLLWTTDVRSDFPSGWSIKVHEAKPGPDGKLKLIQGFKLNNIKKFTRAVIGNGILYVPSEGQITAYGAPTTSPLNCTGAGSFGTIDIGVNAPEKKIECTAKIQTTINSASLSSTEYAIVGVPPSLPVTLRPGDKFSFQVHFKATQVGNSTGTVIIGTTNSAGGYSKTTSVRVSGTAESSGALLFIQPSTIGFPQTPVGSGPTSQSILISNLGKTALNMQNMQFSVVGPSGPFITPNVTQAQNGTFTNGSTTAATSQIGWFTFANLPSALGPESRQVASVSFDPSAIGNFSVYCVFTTNGGNGVITVTANTGAPPVAVLEFQKPDGSGWVTWDKLSSLSFGNVTQNTERSLQLRLRNNSPPGSVALRITISKPPFGVGGIISTRTASELGEGITLQAGETSVANMFCAVPKAQWNTDAYKGNAAWTFNFNDLTLGKVNVPFDCTGVAQQGGPLDANNQGVYRYIGCFQENNPSRQLAQQIGATDLMTSDMCLKLCAAKNYVYCGTQYHRECWGGPKIPNQKVIEGNCNFDCSGDVGQMCGGNGVNDGAGGSYLSMYATNTTIPPQASSSSSVPGTSPTPAPNPGGPFVNPGTNGYKMIGCFSEATTGRSLPNGNSGSVRTVATCIATCKPKGFKYIGLQYTGECWCGSNEFKLVAGVTPLAIGQCNLPCRDNATEYCGAGSRNLVYQLESTLPISNSSSSTTSAIGTATSVSTSTSISTSSSSTSSAVIPTGPPFIRQTMGAYTYQGCYIENNDGTGRALRDSDYFNDPMTLNKCATACAAYKYFGVEYGRECYCGNSILGNSVLDTAGGDAACSFLCPGDETQWCGAGDRLSLFMLNPFSNSSSSVVTTSATTATSTSSLLTSSTPSSTLTSTTSSSFTNSTTSSTTSTSVTSTSVTATSSTSSPSADTVTSTTLTSTTPSPFVNSTISLSTSTSTPSSFTNSTTSSSTSTSVTSTSSTSSLSADTVTSTSTSSSASSTSSSASSTSSSASSTSTSTSSTSTSISSTSTSSTSTSISSTSTSSTSTSVSSTSTSSTSTSVSSTSTSSTSTSVSSTSTSSTSTSVSTTSSSTRTSTSTSSTPTTTSTSTSSTSTRSSTTTTSASTPSATITQPLYPGNANFSYYNCVSEPSSGRLFSKQVVNLADMTHDKCLAACWNYKWAGIEYGRECWCGDVVNWAGNGAATTNPGTNATTSDCSFDCPGDTRTTGTKTKCGASKRMTLFYLDPAKKAAQGN